MKKGFSVLELVISLMVIASIMAAFTPLITKKFSSSIFGKGGKVNLTTDCTDKFNEFCTLCDDKRCIRCTLDESTCTDGQYKDTASCSCKDCKETYGEDCAKCNEKKCLTCPDGQYLDSDNNCQSCSDKFTNCAICTIDKCAVCENNYILNGNDCIADCNTLFGSNCTNCTINACTACKNGYALKNGTCQSCSSLFSNCTACSASTCSACKSGYTLKNGKCEIDCSKFGANCTACTTSACTACASGFTLTNGTCKEGFCTGVDFVKIGNLCVTRNNMGDSANLPVSATGKYLAQFYQSAGRCLGNSSCCWTGNASRTLCGYSAAYGSCSKLEKGGKTWRLPTKEEIEQWGPYKSTLNLCDGSTTCRSFSGCSGILGSTCTPNSIWTKTQSYNIDTGFTYYYIGLVYNGEFKISYVTNGQEAFSVRCVTEL